MIGPERDLIGYGGRPPTVEWPNGARVALSLVVNVEEGSELAVGDGDPVGERLGEVVGQVPPGERDVAMEGMYEYGTRSGFWRLLDIFEDYGVKATFFTAALALERNPPLAAEIRRRGHDVCAHGYRWEEHFRLTRAQERERIQQAVASIARTTGERPLGWYCRYGPSVNTRELIVEEGGFLYDSDAYNDDLPYWVRVQGHPHLVIPYTLDSNDRRFPSGDFGSPVDFEQYLQYGLDRLYKEGARSPKMMSIGLHLRIAGRPARAEAVARFIEYALSRPDVWFARRIEIARWWREHYPA